MEGRFRRWLPVLAVTVALAFVALAAASHTGFSSRELPPPDALLEPLERATPTPQTSPPQPPAAEDAAEEGDFYRGNPALLTYLALFIALFLVIVGYVLYHLIQWLIRERINRRGLSAQAASQPDDAAAAEATDMLDALRAGLADIDAGGDPRRAIIACWLRLERVAATAGSARLLADTSTDLVDRLLSRHQVSRSALERLAEAYRQARYAPTTVGPELADAARAALRDVSSELSAARVAGPIGAAR
jgi:hypothetical protein